MAYLQDLGCHLDVSEHNLVVLGLGFLGLSLFGHGGIIGEAPESISESLTKISVISSDLGHGVREHLICGHPMSEHAWTCQKLKKYDELQSKSMFCAAGLPLSHETVAEVFCISAPMHWNS